MAGDFNATLDVLNPHATKAGADFGQCTDAGRAKHGASVGSWPTNIPQLFGAQIDHVMYTTGWHATAMRVIGTEDSKGSDHRPVVVTLSPGS
jgi:endonuclease/exonuclease/phosphatase (EEP) superfamily protein YafD